MKARRKSDGEIIEVREWRGASDVIYSLPDMNQFYQVSDLDFDLDADTVIQGWVARGEEDNISVFQYKPERNTCLTYGFWDDGYGCPMGSIDLPKESFPDLTWESDPIEVEIILKRKKK